MKTFIVIMGAGRCGSTSLVSFLNKQQNFNIYGENNGVVYDVLNCILKTDNIKNNIIDQFNQKYSNLSYKNNNYIDVEWYNPKNKLGIFKNSLIKALIDYFHNNELYVGFKEIRWIDKQLNCLDILEDYFKVKYIHLTRNLDDQIMSIQKLGWDLSYPIDEYITKTNSVIETFLSKKKISQFIHKNISTDINFLEEIYQFIIADAEKNQVRLLTTPMDEIE